LHIRHPRRYQIIPILVHGDFVGIIEVEVPEGLPLKSVSFSPIRPGFRKLIAFGRADYGDVVIDYDGHATP